MGKLKKNKSINKRKLSLLVILVVVSLVLTGVFVYSKKNDTKNYIVPHDSNESTGLKLIDNEDKLSETENTSAEQEPTTPTSQNKNTYPKPYEASVCTKTPIEPETDYEVVDWLPYKETKTFAGKAGWRQTCTPDSNGHKPDDVELEPLNTLTYIGTSLPQPPVTYEDALAQSNEACTKGYVSDSFYNECMRLFMNTYGYVY